MRDDFVEAELARKRVAEAIEQNELDAVTGALLVELERALEIDRPRQPVGHFGRQAGGLDQASQTRVPVGFAQPRMGLRERAAATIPIATASP